jgi:hypothetical protein
MATLSVYGMDGRLYLYRKLDGDTEINCSHLPEILMIISLRGEWGVETKKVVFK